MRSTSFWSAITISLALTVAGCEEGHHARSIGFADVTGLPAGNATGALYSGQFIVTSNVLEACRCRVGSCYRLMGTPGATIQVLETDGTLAFMGPVGGADLCRGGVDQDATFWCGSAVEELGNVQYALLKGRFAVSEGLPSSMSGVQEATGATTGLDCDIRSRFSARFIGPLTAAAGASPSANALPSATTTTAFGIPALGIRAE